MYIYVNISTNPITLTALDGTTVNFPVGVGIHTLHKFIDTRLREEGEDSASETTQLNVLAALESGIPITVDTTLLATAAKQDTQIARMPAALGQGTKAQSLPVVLPSDQTVAVSTTPKTATDGSTTITLGGTAQNLFGGTVPVNGFRVSNPDATNDIWIADNGVTAVANGIGCERVVANGGWYECPYKPIGAISIVGAVTGQKITAVRW